MRIRNKLLIYFLSFTIISILIVTADSFYNLDTSIINLTDSKLQAIASIQEHRVETLIKNYKDQISQIATRTDISNYVADYEKTGHLINIELLKENANDASTSFSDHEAVYILDKNGKIITSSDLSTANEIIDLNTINLSKTDKKIMVLTKSDKSNDILLTSPITQTNEFVGYVLIVTDTAELANIVNDYSGLGRTGETVIVYRDKNGDAVYFTPPRFAPNSMGLTISKDQTDIATVQSLLKNESLFKNTVSYNNQPVYAVTKYFDEVDWGLVVKVDKSELYEPIMSSAYQTLTISWILILIIVASAYYFSRSITRPIQELRLGTEELQNGNYSYRIITKSKDEIGLLGLAFNKMAEAVVESRANIDQKVESQTKDILEKQSRMDDQQRAIINVLDDVEFEKEKLSQEKSKIDTVLYSIGDGVFVIDVDYNIIIFNPIAAELSGFTVEEAIGKKYSDILKFSSETTGQPHDEFIQRVFETGNIQEMANHTIITKKDGQKIAVADSAAPLKNQKGKIIGCVVVFRDVTREREVDKVKTEFVSLASHQLRTPLSAINWYAEMLLAGDAGQINDDQKSYLDEIYKGNQRMVELVNSLLNVSRLDLGTFEINPESIKIRSVIDDIAKEMRHMLDTKKQNFSIDYPLNIPDISADPKLLRVIIQNLISNSIKYSPSGADISISVAYNENSSDSAYKIEVYDNGYGIPDNQKDKIFTKLFRADNVRSMDTEGTGLGLYIVKSILDEAGGNITFNSVQDKNTTFTVTLPKSGMKQKTGNKNIG